MSVYFCSRCGEPIAKNAAICPHCGAEQHEDSGFSRTPETIDALMSETELSPGGSGEASRLSEEAESAPFPGTEPEEEEPAKPLEIILGGLLYFWKPIVIILAVVLVLFLIGSRPDRGYYRFQGDTYYYRSSKWYVYNTQTDAWESVKDVPEQLKEDYDVYFQNEEYDQAFGATEFSGSSLIKYENKPVMANKKEALWARSTANSMV